MNIIRKVGEARRREKTEAKRAKREARRKLKAADAKDTTAAEPASSLPLAERPNAVEGVEH
jgi:Spy/CpxP family protein refolding chaperone